MDNENYSLPSEDFVRSIEIHSLLPQQEPFVMIGRLEHFDMKRVVTSTEVNADNIFMESGHMSASGLIENIAQTCAARIGYINKYILKRGIQIGFIGAVRNLHITELPKAGERIYTEVNVIEEIFGMMLASATIECDGRTLVTTEIKIAVKDT